MEGTQQKHTPYAKVLGTDPLKKAKYVGICKSQKGEATSQISESEGKLTFRIEALRRIKT